MIKRAFDCVIVGGGPAGTFAAKILADKSFSTLVIEKRSKYTEKVCGGFVPYRAIQILSHNGIDRNRLSCACGNQILVLDTNQMGTREFIRYPYGKYGIGVFRQEFDRYLANQAVMSGARILFSHPISLEQIFYREEEKNFLIQLPDCMIIAKHLIIATGAMGLLPCRKTEVQKYMLQKQTFGVSEIVRGFSSFPKDRLLFHCPSSSSRNYFWIIPLKNDAWNLGYWMEHPDSTIKKTYYDYKSTFFDPFSIEQTVLYPLRGACLGNINLSSMYPEKAYVIGDAGGNNSQITGEGIRFALESALEAVTKIINET